MFAFLLLLEASLQTKVVFDSSGEATAGKKDTGTNAEVEDSGVSRTESGRVDMHNLHNPR